MGLTLWSPEELCNLIYIRKGHFPHHRLQSSQCYKGNDMESGFEHISGGNTRNVQKEHTSSNQPTQLLALSMEVYKLRLTCAIRV